MKLLIVLFGMMALSTSAANAPADETKQSPQERLTQVTTFAFGGVGYAGITSAGEEAFRQIWKRDDATRLFRALFDNATPEGKCYALVALQQLSPGEFKECAKAYRKNPPKSVETMSGCIIQSYSGLALLQEIERGHYVIFLTSKSPNQLHEPSPPGRGGSS